MGYSTLLDILGSIVIGGILLTILLKTNIAANDTNKGYLDDVNIQQNMAVAVQEIESDFSKIGFVTKAGLIQNPNNIISLADTSSITFVSDLRNDSVLATVNYHLGSTSEMSSTPNPSDRILYRTAPDNSDVPVTFQNPYVTIFKLTYYDSTGNVMACPVVNTNRIEKIQIFLKMQGGALKTDNTYPEVFWTGIKRISPNILDR